MRFRLNSSSIGIGLILAACATARAPLPSEKRASLTDYRAFEVEVADKDSRKASPPEAMRELNRRLKDRLAEKGFATNEYPVAVVRNGLITCDAANHDEFTASPGLRKWCIFKVELFDKGSGTKLTDFVLTVPRSGRKPAASASDIQPGVIDAAAASIADEIARQLGAKAAPGAKDEGGNDRFNVRGDAFTHLGDGLFVSGTTNEPGEIAGKRKRISLKRIRHAHNPYVDKDVPHATNVTLNDRVPPLVDGKGRPYALVTLYNIDPPLDGLPSREPGVDRGADFRDAANLVKATYSNYVSPVFTFGPERIPVPGHPIGHFYVKVQIPGYPTILTGMTTIKRADEELLDLTLGRGLGLGGVLLTPQPGRVNSAAEALEELTNRQRKLTVVDGVHYRLIRGKNVGPSYGVDDGNVTFARFRIPLPNARDALNFFLEYVDRDVHSTFGSLLGRPHKGTGSGCSAFAMAWLKASGIIPFVDESTADGVLNKVSPDKDRARPFWANFHRTIYVPWDHIGCDNRLGLEKPMSARYTVYDLLLYRESDAAIIAASEGLTEKIRQSVGALGATLFQFGAFTPLRDLFVNLKRKDPNDLGDYSWANPERGLRVGFWDNNRFSAWVKGLWRRNTNPRKFRLVREGRFYGVEIDAMDTPRQANSFFARANEIGERIRRLKANGVVPTSCQAAFALGIQ